LSVTPNTDFSSLADPAETRSDSRTPEARSVPAIHPDCRG
jgi:hypothetical protein